MCCLHLNPLGVAHISDQFLLQATCMVCFESYPVQDMLSSSCKHFYCKVCTAMHGAV
jgi:hypothetical protein